ncbi:MAG: sigma 54-interacting transcriptional regulator [Acidobacteria bacterium]|nr:sigma 54-interacting transcriptional regulator [Acidobacteriota bacterium]
MAFQGTEETIGRRDAPGILIVEDEAIVALDLERTLQELGYRIVGKTGSGEEAVQMAEALAPDLVLADIHLEGDIDGIDAAARIRSELGLPVVFLTAFADEKTLERAKQIGPHGYIVKPFEARELRSAVEIAIHTHGIETELQASNENLLAILDAQPHGTVTIDADGSVTFVSTAAGRLLGVDADGVRNTPWGDALPFPEKSLQRIRSILESPQPTDENRHRVLVQIEEPRGVASALNVEVRVDPRATGGMILFLYDVSELRSLRRILDDRDVYQNIVARSSAMEEVFQLIEQVAAVDVPVLIDGETGTGKELVARAIHWRSQRRDEPFVPVNCGGMSEELSLSQLFGHRRGSFTGASSDHKGVFEQAGGGTLFLDEVGNLPPKVQTMLLRVLEDKTIVPIGETRPRSVDVRVIAAANRPLMQCVESGEFRADLMYRLQVARIPVPPLRDRREDIALLTRFFLEESRARNGKSVDQVGDAAMSLLIAYDWPGNVRQLENAIEFAVLRCRAEHIRPEDLSPEITEPSSVLAHGDDAALIKAALQDAGGNRTKAAEMLGISRATLYRRLGQYGFD